jgi:ABC-type antimicrobial peptide transport system permease subunit
MFSLVALSIAAVGIYGVISYSVARRTREFGLRMVLGAQSADVIGLVMRQGFTVTMTGIVAGLIAAFALTRLMTRILFQTRPTDPATFAVVTQLQDQVISVPPWSILPSIWRSSKPFRLSPFHLLWCTMGRFGADPRPEPS